MSRVAKMPISLNKDTTVQVGDNQIIVKGKLGQETFPVNSRVDVTVQDNQVLVKPKTEDAISNMHAGTVRSVLNNLAVGVTNGFERKLLLVGVGYKAAMQGSNLNLALGFSHPIVYVPPVGIKLETPSQTEILVKGTNKQLVGEVAAKIRAYRSPDPYKGKGVRYSTEVIKLKETKKK